MSGRAGTKGRRSTLAMLLYGEQSLDARRVAVYGHQLVHPAQFAVGVEGFVEVALHRAVHQFAEQGRIGIAHHRDDSLGTQGNQFEGDAVIAAQHVESFGSVVDDVFNLGDVARCFLDGNHLLAVAGYAQGGFGKQVHAGAARHVVEHHGHGAGFGYGLEVLVETFLRRLVIIRSDNQHTLDSVEVKVLEEIHHLGRVVATSSQQQRKPACVHALHCVDYSQLVVVVQTGCFGCRAEHAEEVGAIFDLVYNQFLQRIEVDAAVCMEGSDKGDAQSPERIYSVHCCRYCEGVCRQAGVAAGGQSRE